MCRILLAAIAALLGLTLLPDQASAQSFGVDPTFGTNGWVIGTKLPHASYTSLRATAVRALPDGRFLVALLSNFNSADLDLGLFRFHSDGTLDNTFGNGGSVSVDLGQGLNDDYRSDILIDSNGRIVLVGVTDDTGGNDDWHVIALTPSGQLDGTFSADGRYSNNFPQANGVVRHAAVDAQNNIYLLGSYSSTPSISDNGTTTLFGLQANGAGGHTVMNTVGEGDVGFVRDSQARLVIAYSGLPQTIHARRYVTPLTTPFPADPTFAGGGSVANYNTSQVGNGGIRTVLLQSDGKVIILGGACCSFFATRYTASGMLDTTFGTSGFTTFLPPFNWMSDAPYPGVVDSEDRIYALMDGFAGGVGAEFAVMRLTKNGQLDTTFDGDGYVTVGTINNDYAHDMALMPDGDLLIVGETTGGVAITRIDLGDLNMVANGSFETADPLLATKAAKWQGKNLSKDKRACGIAYIGSCAFKFVGSANEKSVITQVVKPPAALRVVGSGLTLGVWAKGSTFATGKVVIYYTDGTRDAFSLTFGPAANFTYFSSEGFIAPKAFNKLKVSIKPYATSGTELLIDDAQLIANAARTRVLPPPLPPQFRSSGN